MSKEVKEPAVRMIKRDTISTAKAWGIRLAAVALSLIVAGLVIVAITKQNPIQVYLGIIDGAVGSSRRVWVTIRETLVLLCIAIGLTPAFKNEILEHRGRGADLNGRHGNRSIDDLCRGCNAKLAAFDTDLCCQCSGRSDLGTDPGSV